MQMIPVAKVAELQKKSNKTVSLLGKKVAVFARPDGTYFAMEVTCKHQGADLTMGEIDGLFITCPRHGWQYDLRTGECLNHPDTPKLRLHHLEVNGDQILVSLTPK